MTEPTIRRLAGEEILARLDELAEVLLDCVEGGASVSFMWPLPRERALAFWRGIGEALMGELDRLARACGKSLLVLDTVSGSAAERLYLKTGWTRVGEIPDYALMPDGTPCPTTYFYKRLAAAG